MKCFSKFIQEAKLSASQRDRLDDLILNVHMTTHPEYDGDERPKKYLDMIRKEFGEKVAKQVDDGVDKVHWGRDNQSGGNDKLAWRKGGARITKSGKMNAQDVKALKNRIRKDKAWGGITKAVKLPEEVELEEQKMTFQDAEKLKSKHLAAMQHHKKSGNSKGYAAHSMVVDKFEDAHDRHGTGVIPVGRIMSASQKAFKDHPHSSMKEEIELGEKFRPPVTNPGIEVEKKNYSWGKMIRVYDGARQSYPLHPEHQEKIRKLKDGQSTTFTDETRSKVTASRKGDTVHLQRHNSSSSTPVAHSHFTEEVEQIDEISQEKLRDYHAAAGADRQKAKGQVEKIFKDKKPTPEKVQKTADAYKRFIKRGKGMTAAANKMSETVDLDEVSDKKLDAYRQKAFADQPSGDDGSDKYRKRKFGRDLAFAKQTGRAKVLATKEEVEINEASDLRVTKVYNKFPKKATYAVHSPDRKYYKEFDTEAEAKAHKASKNEEYFPIEEALNMIIAEGVDIDDLTEAQLDELIGTVARAIGRGVKSAVMNKKGNFRFSTAGRADAAEAQAKKLEKARKDRERLQKARERIQKERDRVRNRTGAT